MTKRETYMNYQCAVFALPTTSAGIETLINTTVAGRQLISVSVFDEGGIKKLLIVFA